jgi:hypothetical protein
VRARDSVGNPSDAGTNALFVDTVAPSVTSFLINGTAEWTASRNVSLTIAASDPVPGSGLYQMRIRNDSDAGSWEAYFAIKNNWLLSDVDGTRTVWVDIKDNAGNITSVSDTIGLDRSNPVITTFFINESSPTSNLNVRLMIAATDGPTDTPYQMQFSNDGSTWSGWETYDTTKNWKLMEGEDGLRTVYIEVNDRVGHTASANDTIDYEKP